MRMLDLFAGELGWTVPFIERGWSVTAVDLRRPSRIIPNAVMFFKSDVLDWNATDLARFDFICASSPCPEFSVHGMKHFHPNPKYPELGIKLFNHTRYICESAGVPYILENVRAAQQFVGQAVHHSGPFYLWGTGVPPILPQGISKGMALQMAIDKTTGKRILLGGRKYNSGSKKRAEESAKLAIIPPELANCVAEYAERLITQKVSA